MILRKMSGAKNNFVSFIKPFMLGVLTTLIVIGILWCKKNYKSIVMAVTYPEVVAQLEIKRDLSVK